VAWESLGVVGADRVHVVVNRFVRRSEIQQDTIDMLTLGQRSQILIPDLERGLERAGNSRTPAEVRNQTWWRSLRAIGAELDVTSAYRDALATTAGIEATDTAALPTRRSRKDASGRRSSSKAVAEEQRRPRARRVVVDSGQATLETVAMFPFALLVLAIALQAILLGVTFAYSGVAAGAAARAVSLGNNPAAAVADALPSGMHSKVSVSAGGSSVNVTVRAPLLVGSGITRDVPITVDHRVVEEPR
jgi:pilus assembly protein CpaE